MDVLERATDEVLTRYMAAVPKADELARAKTQLVADATYRHDSQYQMAATYGQALAIGLTIDDVEEWPDRIRAVTGENVRKAAGEFLKKKEAVTGYLLPQKK